MGRRNMGSERKWQGQQNGLPAQEFSRKVTKSPGPKDPKLRALRVDPRGQVLSIKLKKRSVATDPVPEAEHQNSSTQDKQDNFL